MGATDGTDEISDRYLKTENSGARGSLVNGGRVKDRLLRVSIQRFLRR